jgi:HAD superfamily hydrolase (TIGR01484 family)
VTGTEPPPARRARNEVSSRSRLAPLTSLAPEARDIRGVLFDVDDTVTRGGVLDPDAYAAIHALARAGLTLLCATGRPLGWADLFARMWPVRAAVGENGAGWAWRDGERVREGYAQTPSERETAARLLDRIRERAADRFPDVPVTGDHRARRCDLAFDIGESHEVPRTRVEELVAMVEEEGARASVSSVHVHAIPGAWDKVTGAIGAARDALGVDLVADEGNWLFVGDSGNDAAAFAFFRHSVGVANVRGHLHRLPVPPAYVTAGDRGTGFAELARALLDARGD